MEVTGVSKSINVLDKSKANKTAFLERLKKDIIRNKYIYIMLIPVVAYYIVFHYGPMYGTIVAFKKFSPKLGIMGSEWVGLKYFKQFLASSSFWRLFKNTIVINFYNLLFGFPAPIILALLINEIKNSIFKKNNSDNNISTTLYFSCCYFRIHY